MEALEILRGPEPLERALDASTFASGEFILDQ
jgi:hypothetical protein